MTTVRAIDYGGGMKLSSPFLHNQDAEQVVLGALLSDAKYLPLAPFLRPDSFAAREHRVIYREIADRAARGEFVNAITLKGWADDNLVLGDVGGHAYLVTLLDVGTGTPKSTYRAYAEVIEGFNLRRQLVEVGEPDSLPNIDAWARIIGELQSLSNGPAADGFPYFSLADAKPVLSGLWAVKGVLPLRGIAVIYGPSGGGKTFVVTDLLMAVARGVPWRGRKTTQRAVLYLAPDGGSAFVNRICAYRLHHGIDEAPFFAIGSPVDILGKINAGDVAKLGVRIADIEKTHGVIIGVIVVDTVSRAMPGGDENQPADMSRFVDNLGRIGGNGDRLAVGVHHTPKSDATVIRGHSSLHGAADCELNVNDGAIRVAKSREGPADETFGFRLEVVDLGSDEDGDTVTSCVAVPTDVPKKRPAKVTGAARLALDQLRNTIIEAGQPLPRVDKMPRATGVKVQLWRERWKLAQVDGLDKPNSLYAAFRRNSEKLQALGIIGVWDGWVWLVDGVDS